MSKMANTKPSLEIVKAGKERSTLEPLEKEIIKLLRNDSRTTFQSISRELKIDEKTVRNRISKLREAGLLNFTATTDANALDGCIVALVGVRLQSHVRGDATRIIDQLMEIPMVSWAGLMMGRYDIMLEVIANSWDALTEFEVTDLPSIDGIGQTESFLVLSHHGQRGIPFVDSILS